MKEKKKGRLDADSTTQSSSLELPAGEILLYQTEGGQTRIQVRLQDETVWLSQRLMAELFQKDIRTINEHIKNIYAEGELEPEPTIRKFQIVQTEGDREVARDVDFYNIEVIISVGYQNIKNKNYDMIVSPVHFKEVEAIEDVRERLELITLLNKFGVKPSCNLGKVREMAEYFFSLKFGVADAAHLAFAEKTSDAFITCDDKIIKKSKKTQVKILTVNPVAFCTREGLR